MSVVVVATHNAKKAAELHRVLAAAGLEADVRGLDAFPAYPEPAETERSFEGNALLKARAAAAATGRLAVADDSGLEVDALGGAPGVYSARYAGPGASDADRYRKLLDALTGVPWDRRGARFRCAVGLATPDGELRVVDGACEGVIAFGPTGDNGFGYDPVFYMPEHAATMAQLPSDRKNQVSHRARAAQRALRALEELLAAAA